MAASNIFYIPKDKTRSMENYRDETHNITTTEQSIVETSFREAIFHDDGNNFGQFLVTTNRHQHTHTHFWNQIVHQSGFNDRVRGDMNHWNS